MTWLQGLRFKRPKSGLGYWEERARKYGALAVCNVGHDESEIDAITSMQMAALMPLLDQQLDGSEKSALDFGCGTGRFTRALADRIDGRVLAVDPIASLIELAPGDHRVDYALMRDGRVPTADATIDLVWVCLVLGAITDDRDLQRVVLEIERVLRPGGLLFLVENTAKKKSLSHFHFRRASDYASLFTRISLQPVGAYDDLGEEITALAGRRS